MAKVTVLGGGTWGIALAQLLDKNGHEVTVWSALEKEIKVNEIFLSPAANNGGDLHGCDILDSGKANTIVGHRVVNPLVLIMTISTFTPSNR